MTRWHCVLNADSTKTPALLFSDFAGWIVYCKQRYYLSIVSFRHRHMFNGNVATGGWYSNGNRFLTERCVSVVKKSTCMEHVKETHTRIQKEHRGSSNGRAEAIPTDLICTNATRGSNDNCDILPGSALVKYDEKSRKWYLGGLLTWGNEKQSVCKKYMNSFDIYSKIDKYTKWIRKETQINLVYPDEKDARAKLLAIKMRRSGKPKSKRKL